jgi:hypothetical protein
MRPLRPPPPPPATERVADAVDRWFLQYVRDMNLLPVTLALFGHLVLLVAGLLLGVWRTGSVGAGLGLAVLGALSVGLGAVEARVVGIGGRATWIVVATWLGGVALAWYSERTDFL